MPTQRNGDTPASSKSPRSGMLYHYRVQVDGKVLGIRTAMIDVLRWEREHDGTSWAMDSSITGVLHMAWLAGKRLGLVEGIDQAGWAASVEDFSILDPDDETEGDGLGLDPTSPAR